MLISNPTIQDIKENLNLKIEESSVAPDFTTTTSYSTDDYVVRNGKLYKFVSDHVPGNWNNNDIAPVNVMNEMLNMKPNYTASTVDLIDGESELNFGELYFYYEV